MKISHRTTIVTATICILGSSLLALTASAQEPAYTIEWQGLTIETIQDMPAVSRTMGLPTLSAGDDVYYFVQFTGPITRDMKEQVAQTGGELLTYVPNNTYIVRIGAADLSEVEGLPVVQWVGVYQPALRFSASMRSLVLGEAPPAAPPPREFIDPAPADDRILVTVRLFPGADVAAIEQAAQNSGGEVLESSSRDRGAVLRVRMTPAQAAELAGASGVMLIEEFRMPTLLNDQGRNIIDVAPVATTLGLQGNGQVVGIADSGIDSGVNDATMHADLAGRIVAINSWPVQAGYGATNAGADDGAADVDRGHGTHTTGSFVGNGSVSGNLYRGTAPQASVVFQAIEQWTTGLAGGNLYALTGLPIDLNDLFQEAYDNGARIHSNSWGSDDAGAYTATSDNVDEFVWNNPDMMIVFSAGNAGVDADTNNVVDLDSIGSPGTAKNALTVGASENNRPGIQQTWAPRYGNVIDADQQANNTNGIAAFSSRGPTDDLRTKPDVVAPGTMIASIRSQASPNTVWFADNMEGGLNGWTGQGTWGQINNASNSATTSWHDSPVGNYAGGVNISLTSPPQNLSGGGQGGKFVQFFAQYALGTGDGVWFEVSPDGGANWFGFAQPIFQGTQPAWELTTIGLGPFSNAANFQVRLRLQADVDGNTADGVYVDDFRITEGAFGTALMSDFGIEAAGSANDTNYMLSNGTSMATPLTAGAAAIVRQYYTDIVGMGYVSAALIRATLVNGTVDLSPGQYGVAANREIAAAPDNAQGWGRVSLEQSLLPTAPAQLDFVDELAGLETGESRNYELVITDTTVPARITMVYHDFPGSALVNHLDLTVTPPGGGPAIFPNGLTAVDNVNNVERIIIPVPVAGTYTIQVNGQSVPEGPQPYALVTSAGGSITDRSPVDLMLVLDMSGSMLSPACPGCDPKLDVLQDAVELFIQLRTAVAITTDRMGVTYFRTNIDEFDVAGTVLLDVVPNAAAIISDVQSQTIVGFNLTAMGGGIQTALGELVDATRPRSLILFTDGMQNVNPMVLEIDDSPPPGAFHLEIDDQPSRPASGVTPATPPTRLDSALGIKVNTIGVGTSTPFEQLLTNIASETGGLTKLTIAPDDDLRRFFVEELIDTLRGFSPQLVDYRKDTLSGDEATEVFQLNNSAHQVVFKLSWQRGVKLTFQVEKEGVDLTRIGRIISGPFYQIYTLDLPTDMHGTIIGSGGEWALKISGAKGSTYDVAAIVDEDQLGYALSLSEDVATGDPIELRVRLRAGSRPITDATVSAKVLKPGAALGSLLATTALPPSQTNLEPNLTIGQQKVQLLLQDAEFYAQLRPTEQTITLQTNADGSYSGTFSDTDLAGSYTVIFTIEGQDPHIGVYRRTEERSTVVHFGEPDFGRSNVQLIDQGGDPSQRFLELQIRPRDHAGNYLGPDYGHKIRIELSNGSVSRDVEDRGDGTYSVTLTVPPDVDPELRIEILGKPLFEGQMSDVDKINPWVWVFLILLLLLLFILIAYLIRRA